MRHIRPGLPPMLILHGTADVTVPFDDVQRFCAASTTQANRCEVIAYEGATHGVFNPTNAAGKWYRDTLRDAERFLAGLGYVPWAGPR